jgi:hypothetical protein
MENLTKYYSVRKIAEIYGFTTKTVTELCHSRGQTFAFKLKPKGRFYIDARKFKAYIDRKRREG